MKPQGVTRRAAIVSAAGGVVIFIALAAAGNLRAGLAAAVGLGLGSVNGVLADIALAGGITPRGSVIPRLGILSALAIGAGFAVGLDDAWIVILGVGVAQFVLVGMAARALVRR